MATQTIPTPDEILAGLPSPGGGAKPPSPDELLSKAPPDARYETKLSPEEEPKFQQWKAKNAPEDSGADYDLRGLFKSGQGSDARGHATDQFKKPNHPTFSTESQYSGKDGNIGGQWIKRDGKSFFVPSQTNMEHHSTDDLRQYFQEQEPDVELVEQAGPQGGSTPPPGAQVGDRLTAVRNPDGTTSYMKPGNPYAVQVGAPPILGAEPPAPRGGIITPSLNRPAASVPQLKDTKKGTIRQMVDEVVDSTPLLSTPVLAYEEFKDLVYGFNKIPAAKPGTPIPDALVNGVLRLVGGLSEPQTIAMVLAGAGAAKYLPELVQLPKVAALLAKSPAVAAGVKLLANAGPSVAFATLTGKNAIESGYDAYKKAADGNIPGAIEAGVQSLGNAAFSALAARHAHGSAAPVIDAALESHNATAAKLVEQERQAGLEAQGTPEEVKQAPRPLNTPYIPVEVNGRHLVIQEFTQGASRVFDPATGEVLQFGKSGDVQSWLKTNGAKEIGRNIPEDLDGQYSHLVDQHAKMQSRLYAIAQEIEGLSPEIDASEAHPESGTPEGRKRTDALYGKSTALTNEARNIAQDMAVTEVNLSRVQQQRAKLKAPGTTPPGTPRGAQPPLETGGRIPLEDFEHEPGEPIPGEKAIGKGDTFKGPDGAIKVLSTSGDLAFVEKTDGDGKVKRTTMPVSDLRSLTTQNPTSNEGEKEEVPTQVGQDPSQIGKRPTPDEILETIGQTPAAERKEAIPSQSKSQQPVTFTTSKGSTYAVNGGSTTRTKTPHEGHDPNDVGEKEPSALTVYVDPKFAGEVGMWNTLSSTRKRIVVGNDGKITLISAPGADNKQGRDATVHDNSYSTVPAVGLAPLELFDESKKGHYSGNHPGNVITSVGPAASKPTTPVEKPSTQVAEGDEKLVDAQQDRVRQSILKAERESDSFKRATPEEQKRRIDDIEKDPMLHGRAMAHKTIEAIRAKEPQRLLDVMGLRNPSSRQLFQDVTGITLPKTESGTEAAIRDYVGHEKFDAHQVAKKSAHDTKVAVREAEERKRADDEALDAGVSWDGTPTTWRRLIDKGVTQGRTLNEVKRGKFTVGHFETPDGRFLVLRKAAHIRYAKEKIAERDDAGSAAAPVDRVPLKPTVTFFSGKHSAKIQEAAKRRGDIGLVITPDHPEYVERLDDYPAAFVDNGAFGKAGFNAGKFEALLKRLAANPAAAAKVQFVVAPDTVGDAEETLKRFKTWEPIIHAAGLPVAFVAQDGLEDRLDEIPWDKMDTLFIGGSTEWKLGQFKKEDGKEDYERAGRWRKIFKEANRRDIPVHIGRVNSDERMGIAGYGLGAKSMDGTLLAFGEDANLPRLEKWLDKANSSAPGSAYRGHDEADEDLPFKTQEQEDRQDAKKLKGLHEELRDLLNSKDLSSADKHNGRIALEREMEAYRPGAERHAQREIDAEKEKRGDRTPPAPTVKASGAGFASREKPWYTREGWPVYSDGKELWSYDRGWHPLEQAAKRDAQSQFMKGELTKTPPKDGALVPPEAGGSGKFERPAAETKAPPAETKAPVTETKAAEPATKPAAAETQKELTPAEIDAAVLANLTPKAQSAREKFLARKAEGPVRSSVETPGERPAKAIDPQDLEELATMGAVWAVQDGYSYGRWSVRAVKELREMGVLPEYHPYLREIHERSIEIVDAERDVVTAPVATTAAKTEERSPEEIPERVKRNVQIALDRLKIVADGLKHARVADEKFHGEGRYEWEVWENISNRDKEIADALATLNEFKAKAAEKGISGASYIEELGGIPNFKPSAKAREWGGEKPAPRSTPAKAEEPGRDMAEVETRLAESETKLGAARRDYDKLLHLYDLATTTGKLRPEEEDEFTYAGFHVNDKGHAVDVGERTDLVRKALILAGRKFDSAAKAHDHALWTAAQSNPLLQLQPEAAIPTAKIPTDEDVDKDLQKSIDELAEPMKRVLFHEKLGEDEETEWAAEDVKNALKYLDDDIRSLEHASPSVMVAAESQAADARKMLDRLGVKKANPLAHLPENYSPQLISAWLRDRRIPGVGEYDGVATYGGQIVFPLIDGRLVWANNTTRNPGDQGKIDSQSLVAVNPTDEDLEPHWADQDEIRKTMDVLVDGNVMTAEARDRIMTMFDREQPAKPAKAETPAAAESALIPEARQLIEAFRSVIRSDGRRIKDNIQLMAYVKGITGRTPGDGAFDTKQVYDLLETAVNQEIAENGHHLMHAGNVLSGLQELRAMLGRLPTQAIRSDEQIRFQQFSTPPTEALVAAHVLGILPDDLVAETSAGTGGLAAFARAAGATVITNEITPRRAALLRMSGYNGTELDGEQFDNFYDEAFPGLRDPTAVLMNPPFSAAGARGTANTNDVGYRHVLQALRRLQPGGRLVAILGEGARLDAPNARDFWKKVRERATVRANVGINGKEYAKYGTTFGNRIIVIDKVPAKPGVPQAPVTGEFDTLEEAWKALAPIAADRIAIPPTATRLPQQPGPGVGHSATGSGSSAGVGTSTGGVREPGGESGTSVRGGRDGGSSTAGGHEAGSGSHGAPGGKSDLRPEDGTAPDSAVRSGDADVSPTGPARSQLVKQTGKDIGDYVAYVPSGVPAAWGAQPHNASIVETQTMASVPEPPLTMKPNLPQDVISSGDLSAVQLATVAHTIQAHELFSKNGRRVGFFNGDGTGVGKGRTNAATAVHYWRTLPEKKRRTVWISFNEELAEAARDDLDNVGGKQIPIYSLEKVKVGKTIPYKDGVLFVPYSKLAAQQNTKADGSSFKKGATKAERAAGQKQMRRLAQIMEWAGEEPLIIFDESQKAKNATTTETEIPGGAGQDSRKARQKPTATGLAAIEIQNKLPKARVLYSSATGFSDVSNMAYANRLDAWGEGTSFKDFEDFRQQVTQGGISMMEMVARNLKAEGKYLSRFISYDGVKFEEKTHEISSDQHKMLDKAGDAWRMVIDRFNAAAEATTGNADDGGDAKGSVKSAAMSQLYGAQLRFYRSLYTAMKVPTLIRLIDEALEAKKSIVISVLETGQAQQDRELQRVMQQDDEDLEGADLSPIAGLINMVDNRFPTIEYETVEDPDTHEKITRPVKYIDANGIERVRQNAEALLAKKELLDQLEKLKGEFPDAALDQIINKYGSQNVAEMTKRSERLVRNSQTGKREVQSRGSDLTKTNLHEMQAFQDGVKRIAIISNAASTGISLHSSIRAKNQQQRVHIMLQLKWSADMTLQDLGRTHRTAQVIPPEYVLLSLNVEAEKRFAATIARRLEQLGALSRGERKAGGGATDFSKYNFESRYGNYAVDQVVDQLFSGVDRFGFLTEDRMKQYPRLADGPAVLNMLGLHETDKEGNEVAPNVPVKRFFNRMMILPINMGNELFRAFFETMGHLIESAKRQGQFDEGAEKIKAKELTQEGEPIVVYENPTTHAQAVYYKINAKNTRYRYPWDEARPKVMSGDQDLVRVKASGRLLTVGGITTEFDSDTGSQRKFVWGNGASGTHARVPVDQIGPDEKQKYEYIPRAEVDAQGIPDEWKAQYDAAGPWVITPHHLITGSVLPIWGKIQEREGSGKNETVKPLVVKIGLLDSGERIIGVDVSGQRINKVLGALGHAVVTRPEDVERQLMGGKKFNLAQGATLRRAQVSGNYRIELEGAAHFRRLFGQWGLFPETIASKERWFIPAGDRGMDVLKRVLKELPVTGADDEGPVRASREPRTAAGPVFYSQLGRAIAAKMPVRAMPDQVLAIVRNPQNGVKQDELDWTGFTDWLKEQKGSVTKQSALDFIHANQVQIQEVTKGSPLIEDLSDKLELLNGEWQAINDRLRHPGPNTRADLDRLLKVEGEQAAAKLALQRARSGGAPKFSAHVLPGGENYREVLLTLPEKASTFDPSKVEIRRHLQSVTQGETSIWYEGKKIIAYSDDPTLGADGKYHQRPDKHWMEVARNLYEKGDRINKIPQRSSTYAGGHWTEPNVLAHARINDRTGPSGERILHVEEIQSDWGQQKRGEREKVRAAIKNKWIEIVTRMKKDGKLKVICP